MKRLVAVILVLVATNAMAEDWRNGESLFDASTVRKDTMVVKWIRVDDIQATCERVSRSKGLGGFKYNVDACTFWETETNVCMVYTKKQTTQHIVGHEMRHCFQGSFH